MKKHLFLAAMLLTLGGGAAFAQNANPFFNEKYGTPHEIPPFEKFTMENYREAILKGMDEQRAEVNAIIVNRSTPTFENTIEALEQSGKLLGKVQSVFGSLTSSNSDEAKRALQKEISPLSTALSDDIYLNPELFQKVKYVYDNQEKMNLNREQKSLLKKVYKRFESGGANLDDAKKAQLRDLNSKLSAVQLQFSQNLLHETNNTYVTVDNVAELDGLPQANIEQAAALAKSIGQDGKYTFNMQRPSCNPVLQYCKNRELRRKVYDAYNNRGNQNNQWNNKALCAQIVDLRLQKAKLMGFEDYASMALENRMAKTSENVYKLLDQVWAPAVEAAKNEIADIKAEMKKDGINGEPERWDYRYYLDKAKASKFNIDEGKISEYLEINNVQQGIFYVANKLYGLTFVERTNEYPVYESTAKSWDVLDKDGQLIAIFYSDFFPRDGKGAGAWCGGFRGTKYENGERVIPIVTNVCNMNLPSADKPALQSLDNVETMFHEFGHALHSFFRDTQYSGNGRTEQDFVELPSQINEHWAFEPEVMKVYAKHYKTGEIIPQELLDKVDAANKYGQGFVTTELLAAMYTDMDLHVLKEMPKDLDVIKYEEDLMGKRGMPKEILPRYRMTNFSHTMGGGYSAGYYSYMWSEVLDADAYQAFVETGDIFNQEVAQKFRKYVLTPGGIDDGMTMYINFRGREPKVDALLENRGFTPKKTLKSSDVERK